MLAAFSSKNQIEYLGTLWLRRVARTCIFAVQVGTALIVLKLLDFSLSVKAATLIFISGVVRPFHLLRKVNQVLFIIW